MPRRPAATLTAFAIVAAAFTLSAGAGDLNPPAGPVAPTMKDLLDVEPRQILRNDFDTLTPIVISEPGSYYLGEDILAFPGQHGVAISASDVTLDLNGFRILGNTEVGSIDGIAVTETESNIVVRNGSVAAFVDGLDLSSASNCRVESVRVASFTSQGIRVGQNSVVTGCIVRGPGSTGIFLDSGGVAERCAVSAVNTAYTSFGPAVLRECSARDGSGPSFSMASGARLESCVSENAGGDGFVLGSDSSARGCSARSAGDRGFEVGSDCALEDCVSEDSAQEGFAVTGSNGTLARCVAGGSGNMGFNVTNDCVVRECESRENAAEGIFALDRSQIVDCVAVGNGPSGIRLAGNSGLIRGCSVSGSSGFGINVQGSGNLIVGNSVTSGDGYNIGVGNFAGTILANPSLAGAWDNISL